MFLKCFTALSRVNKAFQPRFVPDVSGFKIVRNNFKEWARVWRMPVKKNNKDLFKFFQKEKDKFINVSKKEVETQEYKNTI